MVGKTVSRYKILEKIGSGGMGIVYKAQDSELGRQVALKFHHQHFTSDADVQTRFRREARAAAALNHAHIITVYEIGECDGELFIAMEYLEGGSLKDLLRQRALTIKEVIGLAVQIAEGLQEAHQAGIIHRDTKPENILLNNRGRVKIADFGLSKFGEGSHLTRESSTPGTLSFMSPEQIRNEPVDQCSDIFSFGVVLYEMISGQQPFRGEYEAAVTYAILEETPEPLNKFRTDVPIRLQLVINKILHKNPSGRYQNVNEIIQDLKSNKTKFTDILGLPSIHTKKRYKTAQKLFSIIIALFCLVLFLYYLILSEMPQNVKPITHEQITFSGSAKRPRISPDGQFLAYLTEKNEDLQKIIVQDLSGSNPIEIFSDFKFISDMAWSPDGSELIAGILSNDNIFRGYIIPRLGGKIRKVGVASGIYSWSPDGNHIISADRYKNQIMISNINKDIYFDIRLNHEFSGIMGEDLSSDGDRIAFLTKEEKYFKISIIDINGTNEHTILVDSLQISSPRWSSNNKAVYYLRSTSDANNLMKIRIIRYLDHAGF